MQMVFKQRFDGMYENGRSFFKWINGKQMELLMSFIASICLFTVIFYSTREIQSANRNLVVVVVVGLKWFLCVSVSISTFQPRADCQCGCHSIEPIRFCFYWCTQKYKVVFCCLFMLDVHVRLPTIIIVVGSRCCFYDLLLPNSTMIIAHNRQNKNRTIKKTSTIWRLKSYQNHRFRALIINSAVLSERWKVNKNFLLKSLLPHTHTHEKNEFEQTVLFYLRHG